MGSSDIRVKHLVALCKHWGISDVVFSPGSRNASLVIAFNDDDFFDCISIVDERSAAFVALGMSQQTLKPTIICCTSGSAALNYAPAIAEAYYQEVPLFVITADRPPEWIDHGEGQSIRQKDIYRNIIDNAYSLPIGSTQEDIWFCNRTINEALGDLSKNKPVHLNFPFREPLYKQDDVSINARVIETVSPSLSISEDTLTEIISSWNSFSKIMIICGQQSPDEKLNYTLSEVAQARNVTILTESTANKLNNNFIPCIDRTLTRFLGNQEEINFQPELVITIGGAIISKKIKSFLRANTTLQHWHVGTNQANDTFQALTQIIKCTPQFFFKSIIPKIDFNKEGNFHQIWMQEHLIAQKKHEQYSKSCQWSDFAAFAQIIDFLPDGMQVHMSNSSPIRYLQLFDPVKGECFCNRGVSGIDGCTSTAVGAALKNNRHTLLITGDLSFGYDINALWNKYFPENLKIIVINNSGGGIFRIIPGPASTDHLEKFFEVGNNASIKHLCEVHGLTHERVSDDAALSTALDSFFLPENKINILEICTPSTINNEILEEYFSTIKA